MREEKTEMMGIILKTNKQKIKNKNTLKKKPYKSNTWKQSNFLQKQNYSWYAQSLRMLEEKNPQ